MYNFHVATLTKPNPRTHRLDARADEETHALVQEAAAITGETVSSFVVTAARDRAEKIVARADRTIMPAEQFDAMVAALGGPTSNLKLQELLAKPSRIAAQ